MSFFGIRSHRAQGSLLPISSPPVDAAREQRALSRSVSTSRETTLFSSRKLTLMALYWLSAFALIPKVGTGNWPLKTLKVDSFQGISGWPENTTVLAATGQDFWLVGSNIHPYSRNRMYMDAMKSQFDNHAAQSIPEAHARIAEDGFINSYFQKVHPVSTFDLPQQKVSDRLLPNTCPNSLKKTDDPLTQHAMLVLGKGLSSKYSKKIEDLLETHFPFIPKHQILKLENPTEDELQLGLEAVHEKITRQRNANQNPQFLFYYLGHSGAKIDPSLDVPLSEGAKIGMLRLRDSIVDEDWLAQKIKNLPGEVQKTIILEGCNAGSFIKIA